MDATQKPYIIPLEVAFNFSDHLLYAVHGGSRSYGTNTKDSDIDYRGCFCEPETHLLGLENIEQTQFQANGVDVVYYALKKYVHLCYKNNPQCLESLFVDENDRLYVHPVMVNILEQRDLFLSKQVGFAFGGYAFSQLSIMTTKIGNKSGRASIIEQYGFDTKLAMHSLRLYTSGAEVLRGQGLTVKRPDAAELLAVRNGKYSYEEFVQFEWGSKGKPVRVVGGIILPYVLEFEDALKNSKLPATPDYAAVNQLLIDTHKTFFAF